MTTIVKSGQIHQTTLSSTSSDLHKAADHIGYEVIMLVATRHRLTNLPCVDPDVANAILESFLIHARNLTEFLWFPNKRKDDIRACDYFPAKIWERTRSELTDDVNTVQNEIAKHIAHLTKKRFSDAYAGWDTGIIEGSIKECFDVFLRSVPPENIPHDFDPFKQAENYLTVIKDSKPD